MTEQGLFNPAAMSINQILDALDPEVRRDKRAWPSALLQLVAVLSTHNMEVEQLETQKAIEKAQDAIIFVAHHLGGRTIYLPQNDKLVSAIHALAIFRAQDYDNHKEMFLNKFGKNDQAWPIFLVELVDVLAKFYEDREELDQNHAMEKLQAIIMKIAHYYGGRPIYIPRGDKIKLAIRDQAIFKAFNGKNHLELALKAKLTNGRIYNIISIKRTDLKALP